MVIKRVRVIDLETAGDGPQDVCEIGWQDVSIGKDGRWEVTEDRGAFLVNPGRAISADTMAVHHIRVDDVADSPYWKDIAPIVLKPEGAVLLSGRDRLCRGRHLPAL